MDGTDRLKDKRILVVDDEPDILETLADLLSMCRVEKAADFESAKQFLTTHSFDFAVLDIMGVDGYKLLEIARERGVTTVMLTAHALSPENIVKSYQEGAAYYIPKEKMIDIVVFLEDILKAQEQGESSWNRWFDRMGAFCEKRFGPGWQKKDPGFWERFPFY